MDTTRFFFSRDGGNVDDGLKTDLSSSVGLSFDCSTGDVKSPVLSWTVLESFFGGESVIMSFLYGVSSRPLLSLGMVALVVSRLADSSGEM